jgi:hypothetical protein
MKTARLLMLVCALYPQFLIAQPGNSCTNAIPLILDGVNRTYATATTANPTLCSSPPPNGSPAVFFSITTNASAECILLNIKAPTAQRCEVTFYASTSCTGGTYQSASSMCFDDGEGIWAFAEDFTVSPNTTYILRVIVTTAGNITIGGQHYTPPNDNCSGALQLSPVDIHDNNACHKGGPGVTPAQLCAYTLENTAFYKYTVANTGVSSIYISNINCDNGNTNSSNGFQIGFFTGTCAALNPLSCVSNSGSTVSAFTPVLPAGTGVFVAVDGIAGSNCQYDIRATNSTSLSAFIKYFTAWKTPQSNILKWLSLQEFNNSHFEIEKSLNGTDFFIIGTIPGEMENYSEKTYSFEDRNPEVKAYYRLKQVDITGSVQYFRTILVMRTDMPYLEMRITNPASTSLVMNVQTNVRATFNLKVVSLSGIVYFNETILLNKGDQVLYKNISALPQGRYQLILSNETLRVSRSFIKTNTAVYKF